MDIINNIAVQKLLQISHWYREFLFRSRDYFILIGYARSMIAISIFLTLILNDFDILFPLLAGIGMQSPQCNSFVSQYSIFCLLDGDLAIALSILLLLPAVLGWRPFFSGLLLCYISTSFNVSASTLDGGDAAASIFSWILLPASLVDHRKWQWFKSFNGEYLWQTSVMLVSLLLFRIQMSYIYFDAGVTKLTVDKWRDGTAMYYIANYQMFGLAEPLKTMANYLYQYDLIIVLATWSIILLEVFLCMGLLASRQTKSILLIFGLIFHILILFFMGIASFALTMSAGLIVYLGDPVFFSKSSQLIISKVKRFLNLRRSGDRVENQTV